MLELDGRAGKGISPIFSLLTLSPVYASSCPSNAALFLPLAMFDSSSTPSTAFTGRPEGNVGGTMGIV